MKLFSLNLPNKIAISALVLICGGLGPLIFYTTSTLQFNLQHLLADQQFIYVGFVANDLEKQVKLRIQALQDIADHLPSSKREDKAEILKFLEKRLAIYRLFPNGIVVIGKDGFGVADYPNVQERDSGDYRELEYFKDVISTVKPAIGKPRIDLRFTNKIGFNIGVPIKDKAGSPVGVLVGFIGLTDHDIFDNTHAKLGKTGEYVLVSVKDGTIITDTGVSPNQTVVIPRNDKDFDHFMSGADGTTITEFYYKGKSLTSAITILDGRWLVLGLLPLEEAFAPITYLEKQIYAAATIILILIVGLMWWLMQYQLKPLTRATRLISEMSSDGSKVHEVPIESDDEVGQLLKTFNILQQELHLSHDKLQQQAREDFLTGLVNRRYFMELADLEVVRSIRYGRSLAVCMLDIDHFKKVNDTYGHKVGDAVLKQLGVVIRRAIRKIDIAGRIGGEEFSILLPETDGKQGFGVAERIRLAIESTPLILENGTPLNVTVSIGIASIVAKQTNSDILLNIADQALYKAKNSGRNKVCMDT